MTKKVYVLRNCRSDMSSYDGFVWPTSGHVSCPDWEENQSCGNGLHGFLWGTGDASLLYTQEDCRWLIVEVDEEKIVNLGGKVKFPEGNVIKTYKSRDKAIKKMIKLGANPNTIMFGVVNSGNYGTSNSGDWGTSNSGDYGTSNSGYSGTSISGDYGKSISGDCGTSTSGSGGKVKTGNGGVVILGYYDTDLEQRSAIVGKVPSELKPNTWYTIKDGKFKECDEETYKYGHKKNLKRERLDQVTENA